MPEYDRHRAVAYAHRWAYDKNPRYYHFEDLGGDCTNFVSQCLYAGAEVMNYTPDVGWYYNSLSDRSAAWTGAGYLYSFLTNNCGEGPQGHQASIEYARAGDIIQLSFDGLRFTHSTLVVHTGLSPEPRNILLSAHSINSDNRPLDTYTYNTARLIKIDGVGEPKSGQAL